MPTLQVHRLHARYQLPVGAHDDRERLDRILRNLLDDALERAVERSGLAASGELCLRRVHVPVRLRLNGTDAGLVESWSAAVADAMRDAAGRVSGDVVHYGSRRQALADVAAGVASGNLERAWAWRRLGLWDGPDDALSETVGPALLRSLLTEPAAIAPVLAAVAADGRLPGLLLVLDPPAWLALAEAALEAAGAPARLAREAAAAAGGAPTAAPAAATGGAPPADPAARPAAQAALLPPAAALRLPVADRARIVGALAVLSALERDPALGHAGAARVRATVVATAMALQPVAALQSPRPVSQDLAGGRADRADETAEPEERDAREPGESPALIPRPAARTTLGGLLFLVHVVGDLELAEDLCATLPLAARPLRWTLHQLAVLLSGAEHCDPAALAFAGLPPDADPPSLEAPRATRPERAALSGVAARIAAALDDRLGPDIEDGALGRVCLRDAEVVADPGWIELHLSLDEVDLDVRRAGLDLDPGYVRWLGAAVHFIYA